MKTKYLEVKNLNFSYKKQNILKDLNFSVNKNEILSIVGASGCGKSTILRIIAGLLKVNSGEIIIDGKKIIGSNIFTEPEKREVGLVFQELGLFPHLTVLENIIYGLSKKFTKVEIKNRVDELLTWVELEDKMNFYPDNLSIGQQQRLALIRAIAPKPKLLMLDEPMSGQDNVRSHYLLNSIKTLLKQEKISCIMVTHHQEEAFVISDKVAVMNNGKFEQIVSPYEIYHKPQTEFVANFIGDSTFLPLEKDNGKLKLKINDFSLFLNKQFNNNKKYNILIRPDNVSMTCKSETSIKVTVTDKIFKGNSYLYYLKAGKHNLLSEESSLKNIEVGSDIYVKVKININDAIIFET